MTPNQLYLFSALLGQVMPPLTDLVNRHIQSARLRFYASLLFSAGVAVMVNVNNLSFASLDNILMTALILWASGQTAYKTFYEGSDWQQQLRFTTKPLPLKELIPPKFSFSR